MAHIGGSEEIPLFELNEEERTLQLLDAEIEPSTGMKTMHYLTEQIQKPEHTGKYMIAIDIRKLTNFYQDAHSNRGAGAATEIANILGDGVEHLTVNDELTTVYGIMTSSDAEVKETANQLHDKIQEKTMGVADIGVVVMQLDDQNTQFKVDRNFGLYKKAKIFGTIETTNSLDNL